MVACFTSSSGSTGPVLDAGFGFRGRGTVCLVDPGLIIGLRKSPMGPDVLGIDGERAACRRRSPGGGSLVWSR